MGITIIDVFKMCLVISISSQFCFAAPETVIDYKKTGVYFLNKTDASACKARVYCILPQSNPKSHLTIGITSVCQRTENWIEEIPIGNDEAIYVFVKAAKGDYFRAVLEELPGTCPTKLPPVTTLEPEQKCFYQLHRTKGSIKYHRDQDSHDEDSNNCKYEFMPNPDYCGVKINFKDFYFKEKFYIEFQDSNFKIESEHLVDKVLTFKFPIYFTTKAKDVFRGEGFNATYEYVRDCSAACSKDIKQKKGYIMSPTDSSGHDIAKTMCFYRIHQLPGYTKLKMYAYRIKLDPNGVFAIRGNLHAVLYRNEEQISRSFGFYNGSVYAMLLSKDNSNLVGLIIKYTQTN